MQQILKFLILKMQSLKLGKTATRIISKFSKSENYLRSSP